MNLGTVTTSRRLAQLRQQMTPSETELWALLRNRRLEGWKFRRQHPVGPYVLDFYCHRAGLAVEVDGAVHDNPEQRQRDRDREAALRQFGIRFFRVTPWRLRDDPDGVLGKLLQALQERR